MGAPPGEPASAATDQRRPMPAGSATAAKGRLGLDASVSALPRAGAADVRRLHRLGIRTVRDLLLQLPFRLESFGEPAPIATLVPGAQAMVLGRVVKVTPRRTRRRGMELTEAVVADDRGATMKVVWFNQPYLAGRLRLGDRLALAGKVSPAYRGGLEMRSPHYEVVPADGAARRIGGLMPVYHLTEGLKAARLAALVEAALPLADEVHGDHRPETEEDWRQACDRMTFAELMELQAAFLMARRRIAVERATPIPYRQEVIDAFKAGVGFELTLAQRKAIWAIYLDLAREVPMNRLLDGDVGSGKTAVAAAAAAMTHAAGLQTVVMAPTEILARQHLERFRAYLEPSFPGLTVELLVSGLPAPERRRVRTAAASGHCALLVGTHALIEEDVELASLGLAVVDEQHRFGTRQRELLREKSAAGRPHFLAMTATPIPRTLALALYGEMELTIMDELPPGRTPVTTTVLPPARRDEAYALVRREVRAGRQAFIICPLIELSKELQARAATAEFERLRTQVFPELRLGLVHGRMKDKDSVMRAFREGRGDVLVATSVVEVGVDVPNATVMLVEGADRFGLAQLHQLRGRVGRASLQSSCVLLSDDPTAGLGRLQLLAQTADGFRLAEEDMNLRGMGELMGPRQHGVSDLAMRGLQQPELLSEVRQEAETLAAADPDLTRWPALWQAAERRLEQTSIS